MCIVQEKLLIKKKIWANYMTKLKEPIYEFDANIHFLPIYIKKKKLSAVFLFLFYMYIWSVIEEEKEEENGNTRKYMSWSRRSR